MSAFGEYQVDDVRSYFARPQGAIARCGDAIAVSVAGLCSFLSFYLIEFRVCRDYQCDDLQITSFHASASWLYIVSGISLLGVGIFIYVAKDLPRIFALAITMSSVSGFLLSAMIVFAMLKEVGVVA